MNIHNVLYTLKKDWSCKITYVTILSETNDDDTGKRTFTKAYANLTAILLPQTQARKFIQDIGYLAANKNFTYGALNDYNTISFIIDKIDLPKNFNFELNGYVVYNNKRYERVSFDNLFNQAWILVCKGTEGTNTYALSPVKAGNTLQMQGSVICELN